MSLYYPTNRINYNKKVGFIRVINIVDILQSWRFRVIYEHVENQDVDIKVYDEVTLRLVIEVTNWRRTSFMSHKKALSLKDNFRQYSCYKLFVCSFEDNYRCQRVHFDPDMDIIEIGFQTQPVEWYEWFSVRGVADGMRPNTPQTRQIIRRKIEGYLTQKGLI